MRVDKASLFEVSQSNTTIDKKETSTSKIENTSAFQIEKAESKSGKFGQATYGKPVAEEETEIADIQSQAGMGDATQMKNQMVVMANSASPEDYQKMQEDGFSLDSTKIETVVTETDKIKMQLAKAGKDTSCFGDALSEDQLEAMTGSVGMAQQLENTIKQADLPVTTDNLDDSMEGLSMAEELTPLNDGAVKYMLDNQLDPTVENLYKAEFSGSASYVTADNPNIDFEALMPQVEQVIKEAGMQVSDQTVTDSKWLVNNNIPLTEENLTYMTQLKELELPQSAESVMDAEVEAMTEGNRPQQAMLIEGYSASDQAQHAADVIENATDEELTYVIANDMDLTIENLDKAKKYLSATGTSNEIITSNETGTSSETETTSTDINLITARRQLEEVRLAMTAEANYSLLKQGISIDTKPLAELVDSLKEQENSYYQNLLEQDGIEASGTNIETFRQTTQTVEELKDMPAYALGIKEANADTLQSLHDAGQVLKDTFEKAGESYETMMTTPRADLGDSIKKAFQNVDDILEDLNMDTSEANERAVRILAYNSLDITEESVTQMKAADADVQQTFQNLSPAVVREMIKKGENPLDMSLSELNTKAAQIKEEVGTDSEDKFSKYLWKLEQNNEISEDEKSSYIGIYRLINQVEKTDGAAIGSLIEQGSEITMRNLLTQVRSFKHNNVEYTVDDDFDGIDAVDTGSISITDQIEKGYQTNCIRNVIEEISPQKMQTIMKDTNWQNMTPEQLSEQLTQQDEEESLDKEYAAEQLSEFAAASESSQDIYQTLSDYNIPVTVNNLLAAQEMINNRNGAFKQFFETTTTGEEETNEDEVDLEAIKQGILKQFGEAVKTPEDMAKAQQVLADTAENVMKTMITETDDISSLDIRAMKLMNAQIALGTQMGKEENYAIPVLVGDQMTNVSLKIVRGSDKKGLVDLVFETSDLGKVAAQIKADQNGITGYIAADSQETADVLQEHASELYDALQQTPTEESAEDQSVDMQFLVSNNLNLAAFGNNEENSVMPEEEEDRQIQTKTLYYMAESFLKTVMSLE